ncbi:uncharacterized protein TNCV_1919111 [Trichonephila clavipes]|nr:uncharacterized protein TNCV_1919111 [Trichonephila clavipes]
MVTNLWTVRYEFETCATEDPPNREIDTRYICEGTNTSRQSGAEIRSGDRLSNFMHNGKKGRTTGIVVSDADCGAAGIGDESRRRHGCVLPQNWGGNEPNRTVPCMVLQDTANDRRHLALCHDEFRGPRSELCRSGGISNNNNNN